MYPENLNVIGQQTSEIFEFKKRLEERKENNQLTLSHSCSPNTTNKTILHVTSIK